MTEPERVERPSLKQLVEANRLNEITQSDTGNARRFVNAFRDEVRFEPEEGRWLVWSGTHWQPDDEALTFALTENVINELRADALAMPDEPPEGGGPSPRQRALAFALRCEAEGSRRRMLSVAATDPRVIVRREELDAALDLLACPNGTVDLTTGELRDSDPGHMLTACTRVAYDPTARSDLLDNYLTTFVPDAEDQEVLFGVLGTALRGGNAARIVPLLLGPSTSGKSMLVAALAHVLRGYAVAVNVGIFRGNLDDRPRPDLVRAMHTRIAYATEAARSWELHADQVKRLAGGEKISYRDLYAQPVEAEPLFTPFIVANDMPRVKGADAAFRRRMLVVRFDRALDPAREDVRIKRRFVEDPGCQTALLARLVAGARSGLFANGVDLSLLPTRFLLETMSAFDEVDHIGSFLLWLTEQGHLVKAEEGTASNRCAKASDLHAWYAHWVKKHGDRQDRESMLNLRDFGAALRTRGWETVMSGGTRWVGYTLISDATWL